MSTNQAYIVDQSGLKVGQALTIVILLLAFVLDAWLLVAFVALAQLMAALNMPFAPYRLAYVRIAKPLGLIKPNPMPDHPEPHRFASLVGSIFNGVAFLAALAAAPALGWVLVWIVIVLANLNFWLNFCLGCWMYYQFNRLGVPGFSSNPLKDGRA